MAALEDIGGQYVYLNGGEHTGRGVFPPFVVAVIGEGKFRSRVQEVSDGRWETVCGHRTTAEEKVSAEKIDAILSVDGWLAPNQKVSYRS